MTVTKILFRRNKLQCVTDWNTLFLLHIWTIVILKIQLNDNITFRFNLIDTMVHGIQWTSHLKQSKLSLLILVAPIIMSYILISTLGRAPMNC